MLFHPGKGISTQEAYRHVQVSAPVQTLTDGLTGRIEDWSRTTVNVFERYAIEQQPVVGLIKEELYGCGAVYASMTGSGAAVYGLFKKEADIPSGISAFFIWKERL
jgi:4-diphosphocytidyl-2-C-methyl-D-erythritol kinase